MCVARRIAALVESLRREGFETMPPAERRHLAQLCRYIADKADPDAKPQPTKAGVLLDLRDTRGRG
jgi:hypothetical protein